MLGEFAPHLGGGDRAVKIGALVLQRLDLLVDLGQVGGRDRLWRARIDRADGELLAGLALDPQRGAIQPQREILRHQRVVAGGQIKRDDTGDARAIGIDGDGIDARRRIEIGSP
jgi:hypothetical protein